LLATVSVFLNACATLRSFVGRFDDPWGWNVVEITKIPVNLDFVDFAEFFHYTYCFRKNPMKYAVIRTGGKQYRVSEGQLVKIEKLTGEVGEKITLADVLFVGGNGEVKIGAPLVANATVTGEIVGQTRAKKVLVFKKKRRKSYSRQQGHRQYQTTLKITAIEA
jgi:large subunit ribosomal protein L21